MLQEFIRQLFPRKLRPGKKKWIDDLQLVDGKSIADEFKQDFEQKRHRLTVIVVGVEEGWPIYTGGNQADEIGQVCVVQSLGR